MMSHKYMWTEKEQLLNRIGREPSWGWSPAVDFVKLRDKYTPMQAPVPHRHRTTDVKKEDSLEENAADLTQNGSGFDSVSAVPDSAPESKSINEEYLNTLISQIKNRTTAQEGCHNQRASSTIPPARSAVVGGNDTLFQENVSILLAGSSDVRHIFRTLASLRLREVLGDSSGAPLPTYHFYIYEPSLRIHCRHLFFIQWLIDSMFSLEELEERVLMFLEIFGNSLIRDTTGAQMRNVTQHLLKSLETETGSLSEIIDFSEMKLKEKDFIENQVRNWGKDTTQAGIEAQWSQLVRQDMAERYDNRDNLIDWDFVFHLKDYTPFLRFSEYRVWRNTGIAFDIAHINPRRGFQYEYTMPNKTLCLFDRQGRGTYLGDIKNGPFFSFGAHTENEFLHHRSSDGTCQYGNGIISMHNVRAWLYALLTGSAWSWAKHAFAWDSSANYNYLPPNTSTSIAYKTVLPRVRFHFIGLSFDRFLLHQIEGRIPPMDAAFFGTSCTQLLATSFLKTGMRQDGVVVTETVKFVVDVDDATKEAFVCKTKEMAEAGKWQQNDQLTTFLHEGQPQHPELRGEPTSAQEQSLARYGSPFQVCFTKQEAA